MGITSQLIVGLFLFSVSVCGAARSVPALESGSEGRSAAKHRAATAPLPADSRE